VNLVAKPVELNGVVAPTIFFPATAAGRAAASRACKLGWKDETAAFDTCAQASAVPAAHQAPEGTAQASAVPAAQASAVPAAHQAPEGTAQAPEGTAQAPGAQATRLMTLCGAELQAHLSGLEYNVLRKHAIGTEVSGRLPREMLEKELVEWYDEGLEVEVEVKE
jgi:hypothetical protein